MTVSCQPVGLLRVANSHIGWSQVQYNFCLSSVAQNFAHQLAQIYQVLLLHNPFGTSCGRKGEELEVLIVLLFIEGF